ncbi:hypothetical protein [Paenibacillus agricola]|uniref:Uncharacterized protein n=1 Tax=Paenibacillus agricola TaxID=2716264 RepID=A0ABX0J862_9BACL|nr:hypothetical protein [Paenibacillus agricola]NHN31369.1 hypothetical protein [Paenibacillus agricola]
MSYDFYYWLIMGVAFVVTNALGVGLMWRTQKLFLSFGASSALDLLIFAAAAFWWASLFTGFARTFGLVGFVIAFVNIEVLLLFALFIMKKKST